MAPISLKIVLDEGAVVRTMAFDSTMRVREAFDLIMEKLHTGRDGKDYALFLTSATDDLSGVWLEGHRLLEYYMLRDGDSLHCLDKIKNLRVRMLDGSVKTLQVDTSKKLADLMMTICDKIGITDYDEYGLCRGETEATEEPKSSSIVGTLTLKRKAQQKEKDTKMHQLSKKLKTDDNVAWLDQHKTLREIGVDSVETLLLKRRLFYSDRNVDSRDPVQLNLLYVQTRDAILEGRHPVTEDQALEFAGIQCQIQHGDYQEDKHKPGLIENLNEYLPEQYSSSWGAEKKILKLYKKHAGLSQLEAKHLYTKTARALPTYGVTFFVVKEQQKGKKKLVTRLLGISSEAILRLDETTKEVLQAWPLTQVMTYHASHNNTFSLNFGDYSEKAYHVKTNDAHRIRDILEGYIDIIGRRKGAPYGSELPDSGTVLQETVQYGRSNVISHVSHTPLKVVEQSYVGPSRIIQEGQAGESSQGTQIVTVQQMVVTQRGTRSQQVMTGEVPLRRDMSLQFTKKLNKMNANSVKIVTLFSDATPENVMEVQRILEEMEADMPNIAQGVREVADKQKTEEDKSKLLGELEELQRLLDSLSSGARQQHLNPDDVQDMAKKIADLTTQMYLNLDPRARNQSKILRRSRASFVEDEKVEANLRRASFIVAVGSACGALDNTKDILTEEYEGPVPTEIERQALEASVQDKMAKINAAIAMLLTSHSDPNGADYSSAVVSMNTINELVPELAKDARKLSSTLDKESREALLADLVALSNAAKQVCALVGSDDKEKIQEATDNYSELSEKLIFRIGRNPRAVDTEKSDETGEVPLRRDMSLQFTKKLNKMNANSVKIVTLFSDATPENVMEVQRILEEMEADMPNIAQGVREVADKQKTEEDKSKLLGELEELQRLLDSLSSGARQQHLNPDDVQDMAKKIADLTTQMYLNLDPRARNQSKILRRSRASFVEDEKVEANLRRASFIVAVGSACGALDNTKDILTEEYEGPVPTEIERQALEASVQDKMAKINAAIAMLLTSHSDPNGADYSSAVVSMNTINELVPELAKDARKLSSTLDKESREALLADLVALSNAAKQVCALVGSDDKEKIQEATDNYSELSEKLIFRIGRNPRAVDTEKSDEIIDLAKEAVAATTILLMKANELTSMMPDDDASAKVDAQGVRCGDAARRLLACARLTAASIHEPHCQSALSAAAEDVSSSSQTLALAWKPLVEDPSRAQIGDELKERTMDVAKALDRLRNAYANLQAAEPMEEAPSPQEVQRLRFITSAVNTQGLVKRAEEELNKHQQLEDAKLSPLQRKKIENNITQKIAQVNAAVASLIQAMMDPSNPDYNTAELSMATISELMPTVVQDIHMLSASSSDEKYRQALLYDMKVWCQTVNAVCAGASQNQSQELNDSAERFAKASQKLSFVFSPRAHKAREQLLLELSWLAQNRATALVDDTNKMADTVGGANASRLRERGRAVDCAAKALSTTVELTAPHIEDTRCRSALLSSTDALASSTRDLVSDSQELQDDETGCKVLEAKVHHQRQGILKLGKEVETALQELKETCVIVEGTTETPEEKGQRLKFIATLPIAQQKFDLADKMLNMPTKEKKLSDDEAKILKDKLEKELNALKSAVAFLLQAKSDLHKTDFENAEEAITTITDLMPSVINDTKSISNGNKKADVKTTLEYLKYLNDAVREICAAVEKDDDKELTTSARKLAQESEKLTFVFHPRKKQPKEEQLDTLCTSAAAEARRMVEFARRAAQALDGVARYNVSEGADRLKKAADMLVTTAQLTSSNINNPQCKTAMTSSADHLLSTAKALTSLVKSAPHLKCKEIAEDLERRSAFVEDTVTKIKQTANAEDKCSRVPPPLPIKKSTLTSNHQNEDRSKLHEGPESENHYHKPMSTIKAIKTSDVNKIATQDFLNALRAEECSNKAVTHANSAVDDGDNEKNAKENEKLKQELAKTIKDAEKAIKEGIDKLSQVKNTSMKASLTEEQKQQYEKRLEENLATASVAAASLLSAKNRDCLDNNLVIESVNDVAEVIPKIAKDVLTLSLTRDDKHKNALLDEAISLCEGAKKLCSATQDENQKLNEAAVEMGDSMARLIYGISPCADPEQERQVIQAAKVIGDSAYKVAVAGAEVARGADEPHAQEVCDEGSKTAHTAGVLVYTAKLVAPSIHHKKCQDQLVTASEDLSSNLANYTCTFKTLPEDKGVTDLMKEADNLEKLLQGFMRDLGEGKMIKRKVIENECEMVIEDTALRKMAVKILRDAKARSELKALPEEAKRKFEAYCNKLADAIKCLDVANHKCHKKPDDLNKRVELENSIQKLQFILLQSRPTVQDKQQNNVVDLTDFVKDVSLEAEKLTQIVNEINIPQYDKAIMAIKDECNSIKQNAQRLINPTEMTNGDSLDGILEMDQFGQDCEDRIARFKSAVEEIEDKKAKCILQDNAAPLSESLNMLRFAIKSALAVAQSAALDETLNDLTDLQKNIDVLIAPVPENAVTCNKTSSPALTSSQARLVRSTMDVSRGSTHELASTVAAYITDARDVTPATSSDRLKQHANKLIDSLKLLLAATSTRVAMFEAIPDAETIKLTQKVLKQVEKYPILEDKRAENVEIVNENDVARLLLPKYVQINGKQEEIADKLQEASTKLNSIIGMVHKDALDPKLLAKTVNYTIDTAVTLANTAKALKFGDAVKDKKIDEDIDDMVWKTFGLFKAAEIVSKDPKNNAARRSLLDACKSLNDSINKLARTANPTKNLKTQCNEHRRTLHIQELLSESYAQSPVCAVPYAECVSELENQQNAILETMKLNSNKPMSRKSFAESLGFVSSAVCNSTSFAAHSAYLLSVSESNKQAATEGVVDLMNLRRVRTAMKDTALMILRSQHIEEVRAEEMKLNKSVEELKRLIIESSEKINDEDIKRDFIDGGKKVNAAADVLKNGVHNNETDMKKIHSAATLFLNAVGALGFVVDRPGLVPQISQASPQAKAMSDDIILHSKKLLSATDHLMTKVSHNEDDDDDGPMTWVTFNTSRSSLLEALDNLVKCLREHGQKAGVIAIATTEATEEPEAEKRSYLQIQVDAANNWLCRRLTKPDVKTEEQAIRNIMDIAEKTLENLKGQESEEMRHLITETEELLKDSSKSYDAEKARALVDKVDDLRKAIERSIVSRVVDDFTEAEEPMADLDTFVDIETDAQKRKFLLEQKIAELLAQLGKVTRTARAVGGVSGGPVSQELERCSQQTELLAPQLVKAAEERVRNPDNQQVVENYRALLAQYGESLSKVRDLCDRAVDPMDFVQTAGEKMQRLREESHQNSDPQRCAYTSIVIRRLANRVIEVGMSSPNAREDAEIMEVLAEAKKRLAIPPPPARSSRLPDWRTTTAEILRATGEVESVLGGEGIFKKQPEPDQPIYNAALSLHTVVRDWSARDNEVVAVAKRMAVLMARLSDFMNHDKKAELIATSKSIVVESNEVARLARKLALECSDIRIRTNLLQACERIPTISGQLKMLTTVKGSSMGHQRSEEDKEAMDMLVGNAQNLMLSVQDVVKGAESASVKIASQRGIRNKWVRKNYY